MNNNQKDRLIFYIIVSLVIHLGLFYFVPWGGFATGLNPEGRTMADFEFIQVVDFEELPEEGIEVEEETVEHEPAEPEEEDLTEDTEPDPEPGPETEVDEPEPEPEEEVLEEPEEEDIEEEVDEEPETEEEVITAEESESEIEAPEEIEEEEAEETSPEEETEALQEEEADAESDEQEAEEIEAEDEADEAQADAGDEVEEAPPSAGEMVLSSQLPVYPKYSVGPEETGEVTLSARVDIDGEIIEVEIIDSSDVEPMDQNAKNTIEHGWDFNSYSSPYTMEIMVSYELDERGDPVIDYELIELVLD